MHRILIKQSTSFEEFVLCKMCIILRNSRLNLCEHRLSVPYGFFSADNRMRKQRLCFYVVLRVNIEPLFGKLHIINISANDVQICVLCVVQIIKGSRFKQVKFLPEFRCKPCLAIYDFGIVFFSEKCGNGFGWLWCFGKLSVNKAKLFIVWERSWTGKSLVFFAAYQFFIF